MVRTWDSLNGGVYKRIKNALRRVQYTKTEEKKKKKRLMRFYDACI